MADTPQENPLDEKCSKIVQSEIENPLPLTNATGQTPSTEVSTKGEGLELLKNGSGRSQDFRDIRLMARAKREGWNLDAKAKRVVRNRLVSVVAKEIDLDHVIAASKVLVDADKNDIAADRNDIAATKPGQTTNVQVNVNLTQAERVARVAALLGQAKPEEPEDK